MIINSGTLFLFVVEQNFLFTSRSEDADMKLIDFGLSDFVRPGNGQLSLVFYL